jgi:plastocyanin
MLVLLATLTLASITGDRRLAEAQSASVAMVDNVFQPASIAVPAGTTVTWVNRGQIIHTATSNTAVFDSGVVNPGGSYSFRFTTAGTYAYTCIVHPDTMRGTIVVQAAAPPTVQATVAPAPPAAQPVTSAPPFAAQPQPSAPPPAQPSGIAITPPSNVQRPAPSGAAPATLPAIGSGGSTEAPANLLMALAVLGTTVVATLTVVRRRVRR